jgi:hypothetical protein
MENIREQEQVGYLDLEFNPNGTLYVLSYDNNGTSTSRDFMISLQNYSLLNSFESHDEQKNFLRDLLIRREFTPSEERNIMIGYDNLEHIGTLTNLTQISFYPRTMITTREEKKIITPPHKFWIV